MWLRPMAHDLFCLKLIIVIVNFVPYACENTISEFGRIKFKIAQDLVTLRTIEQSVWHAITSNVLSCSYFVSKANSMLKCLYSVKLIVHEKSIYSRASKPVL